MAIQEATALSDYTPKVREFLRWATAHRRRPKRTDDGLDELLADLLAHAFYV